MAARTARRKVLTVDEQPRFSTITRALNDQLAEAPENVIQAAASALTDAVRENEHGTWFDFASFKAAISEDLHQAVDAVETALASEIARRGAHWAREFAVEAIKVGLPALVAAL